METSKYRKIVERPGLHPWPHWEAYSTPKTPLLVGSGARCPLPKNPVPAIGPSRHSLRRTSVLVPSGLRRQNSPCSFSVTRTLPIHKKKTTT